MKRSYIRPFLGFVAVVALSGVFTMSASGIANAYSTPDPTARVTDPTGDVTRCIHERQGIRLLNWECKPSDKGAPADITAVTIKNYGGQTYFDFHLVDATPWKNHNLNQETHAAATWTDQVGNLYEAELNKDTAAGPICWIYYVVPATQQILKEAQCSYNITSQGPILIIPDSFVNQMSFFAFNANAYWLPGPLNEYGTKDVEFFDKLYDPGTITLK